jgi:hypothetical protein
MQSFQPWKIFIQFSHRIFLAIVFAMGSRAKIKIIFLIIKIFFHKICLRSDELTKFVFSLSPDNFISK